MVLTLRRFTSFCRGRGNASPPSTVARLSCPMILNILEYIVHQHPEMQDELVGGKVPTGKALEVRIGFYFRMELLAGAMVVIQIDHLLRFQFLEAHPIGIHFDFRYRQQLPFDDAPFGHFENDRMRQLQP